MRFVSHLTSEALCPNCATSADPWGCVVMGSNLGLAVPTGPSRAEVYSDFAITWQGGSIFDLFGRRLGLPRGKKEVRAEWVWDVFWPCSGKGKRERCNGSASISCFVLSAIFVRICSAETSFGLGTRVPNNDLPPQILFSIIFFAGVTLVFTR